MTDDLRRRQHEHATGRSVFTAKYRIDHIVYFETFEEPMKAAAREQQLKRWPRRKKIALIESMNPKLEGWSGAVAAIVAPSARPGPALSRGAEDK